MAQTTRLSYWDNVKALLICVVVLGHTGTAMGDKWLSVIYAFHMPLFVFVSGFFSRKKSFEEFWGGVKRLLVIYLVFDVVYLGLDIFLGETVGFERVITPSFALWYILALIYWKTLLQFLPKRFLDKSGLMIVASFVLAIVAGFVPINQEMSFQRAFTFLPFFLLGYYARNNGMVQWIRKHNRLLMSVLFIGVAVLCYTLLPVFYANTHYSAGLEGALLRIAQLGIACLMCAALLNIIPDKHGWFTELGKWTLLIYLLHPPIVKVLKMGCVWMGIPMTPNVIMAIVISVVSIVMIYFVRKWRIFKYIS